MKKTVSDILNCLANLSSDEVFTSPELANQMLDMLPQDIFSDPNAKFLDPCSKSGVFLREIAKRLLVGLEKKIPDLQQRIDHIMSKQLFGIALTQLTAEMSRRTLYCAKKANGEYSVAQCFGENEQGNLRYMRCEHVWVNGKCSQCGANRAQYDRIKTIENYAYPFIHKNLNEIFKNMQFDVIIGNPPYQLTDGSGASTDAAMPIYNRFIEQAMLLKPRYLSMIVPSKWMVGGRGLNQFREKMMNDKHIKYLYDYENSSDCFAGLHIDGGVCYFLWDSQYCGKTNFIYQHKDGKAIVSTRYLKNDYSNIVIRDIRRQSIIQKVTKDTSFSSIVSPRKPFNISTDIFNCPDKYPELNLKSEKYSGSVFIWGVKGLKGGAKRVNGYVLKSGITKNAEWIDKYKLFISKAYSTDAIIPPQLISADKNVVCSETFLVIGPFDSAEEQQNCLSYTNTNFFRILLYFGRGTMQVSQEVFRFVPLQDFSHPWTDEMLYKKYGLTEEEINFIESMIKPME
ncbi:MAG: Eco57I restriction-modification methylase domain-containing protein [Bacteroidales bacterium]|nr:Eco57I restriction-modification methylase domain-containing protein [Bacteroidales bacterium]